MVNTKIIFLSFRYIIFSTQNLAFQVSLKLRLYQFNIENIYEHSQRIQQIMNY